eukprot:26906-Chlamydomonas_euryale.AAC.4
MHSPREGATFVTLDTSRPAARSFSRVGAPAARGTFVLKSGFLVASPASFMSQSGPSGADQCMHPRDFIRLACGSEEQASNWRVRGLSRLDLWSMCNEFLPPPWQHVLMVADSDNGDAVMSLREWIRHQRRITKLMEASSGEKPNSRKRRGSITIRESFTSADASWAAVIDHECVADNAAAPEEGQRKESMHSENQGIRASDGLLESSLLAGMQDVAVLACSLGVDITPDFVHSAWVGLVIFNLALQPARALGVVRGQFAPCAERTLLDVGLFHGFMTRAPVCCLANEALLELDVTGTKEQVSPHKELCRRAQHTGRILMVSGAMHVGFEQEPLPQDMSLLDDFACLVLSSYNVVVLADLAPHHPNALTWSTGGLRGWTGRGAA